jgi:hypothetical protein
MPPVVLLAQTKVFVTGGWSLRKRGNYNPLQGDYRVDTQQKTECIQGLEQM